MTKLLVSIIIPVKSPGLFTERCLKSIRKQTHKDVEIIIVEGSLSKLTKELAKKYKAEIYYYNPKVPKGFFDAPHRRNFGVKKATGSFVYYLDDDMEISKNTI